MSQNDPQATMRNFKIPKEYIQFLHKELLKKMEVTAEDVSAKIEMTCFSNEAIEGIQYAIQIGLKECTKKFPLIIRIIAAPLFEICLNTLDSKAGEEKLTKTINKMKKALLQKGGKFKIIQKPVTERIVSFLESEFVDIRNENVQLQ